MNLNKSEDCTVDHPGRADHSETKHLPAAQAWPGEWVPGQRSSIERPLRAGQPRVRAMAVAISLLVWTVTFTSALSAQSKRKEGRALPQQERPATQTSPPEQADAGGLADAGKDYLISPGDIIEIRVEDAPELSHHFQVTASGEIEMPVLGRVVARQKTTYKLARLIANGLREQEYLKNPNVIVAVRQYNSRAFFIQGAVGRPGLYRLEVRPSLLTLIGLAGGLTDNHGSTVFILRPNNWREASGIQDSKSQDRTEARAQTRTLDPKEDAQSQANDPGSAPAADYELIKVNLSALYRGYFDQNQRLEPGDIVNIPRADVFFVAGEVKAPGSFALKDGTTLRQAISLAQGMTFKAKPSRGIIFREDPTSGSRQEIKVDISAVMNGKNEDIPVQANDVIIVPNSQAKSVGGTLLTVFGFNWVRYPLRY